MVDKQEILDKHKVWLDQETSNSDAFAAMDEYAKQVAVGFIEWAIDGHLHGDVDGNVFIGNFTNGHPEDGEGLFDLFVNNNKTV